MLLSQACPQWPDWSDVTLVAYACTHLQELPDAPATAASSSSQQLSSAALLKAYGGVYERLQELGFSTQQAQQALKALPRGAAAELDTCLDWLCLNLPQHELPRRFAGNMRALGTAADGQAGIKVGLDWLATSSAGWGASSHAYVGSMAVVQCGISIHGRGWLGKHGVGYDALSLTMHTLAHHRYRSMRPWHCAAQGMEGTPS